MERRGVERRGDGEERRGGGEERRGGGEGWGKGVRTKGRPLQHSHFPSLVGQVWLLKSHTHTHTLRYSYTHAHTKSQTFSQRFGCDVGLDTEKQNLI